ncbi:MAG: hypothetical protein GY952_05310 [Rhodobacteraceae bacterium]|nr:hypothetical protein [Paracoccaceae bacterium]
MPTGTSILTAFSQSFPGLIQLLTALAYGLGMWAGGSALVQLWRWQRYEPDAGAASVIMRMVLCAVLLFLPESIESGNDTIFGAPNIMSYRYGSALSASGKVMVDTAIGFVQIVGLWAFIYGWLLLKRAHQRSYDAAVSTKGVVHIVGGVLAMNMVATLKLLAETFGLQSLLAYLIA